MIGFVVRKQTDQGAVAYSSRQRETLAWRQRQRKAMTIRCRSPSRSIQSKNCTPPAADWNPRDTDRRRQLQRTIRIGLQFRYRTVLELGRRLGGSELPAKGELRCGDISTLRIGRNQANQSIDLGEASHRNRFGGHNRDSNRPTARLRPTTWAVTRRLRNDMRITPFAPDILPVHRKSQFATSGRAHIQSSCGRIPMGAAPRIGI